MHVKKGDQVAVIAGKDKGKKGRIMMVYPETNMVLVEKVNYQTVYLRRSQQNPNGGITKVEGKLHASNVQLVDPRDGKPTRTTRAKLADGTKNRISKRTKEII